MIYHIMYIISCTSHQISSHHIMFYHIKDHIMLFDLKSYVTTQIVNYPLSYRFESHFDNIQCSQSPSVQAITPSLLVRTIAYSVCIRTF